MNDLANTNTVTVSSFTNHTNLEQKLLLRNHDIEIILSQLCFTSAKITATLKRNKASCACQRLQQHHVMDNQAFSDLNYRSRSNPDNLASVCSQREFGKKVTNLVPDDFAFLEDLHEEHHLRAVLDPHQEVRLAAVAVRHELAPPAQNQMSLVPICYRLGLPQSNNAQVNELSRLANQSSESIKTTHTHQEFFLVGT